MILRSGALPAGIHYLRRAHGWTVARGRFDPPGCARGDLSA